MLAAIGKVETNHGQLQAAGVTSGANFAGAAGPMQIGIGGKAGNTFGAYAVDGDGDGISNVYNPADAIFTAASYLCRNGGGKGGDLSQAVFAIVAPYTGAVVRIQPMIRNDYTGAVRPTAAT